MAISGAIPDCGKGAAVSLRLPGSTGTSGATFAVACRLAAGARPGANILCMLPDTGERYLSSLAEET